MNQETRGRRAAAVSTVMLFCLMVFFPLAAQIGRLDAGQSRVAESRSANLPDFGWNLKTLSGFARTLSQGWLDKNFAYRGHLIRWYNYYSARIFGSMAGGAPVVVGLDGWLFLAKDRGRDVMEEHRAAKPIPEDRLAEIGAVLKGRQDWLAERGIAYLVAVAPNKDTVYPEYLHAAYAQVGKLARIDQIVDYLTNRAGVNCLDLRAPLLDAKKREQVFYATDSHWNAAGAFVSYQAIINRLAAGFPALAPMKREDFYLERYNFFGGDLSFMVGLQEMVAEDRVYLLPKHPFRARGESLDRQDPGFFQPPQVSRVDDPELPRAVFFHDSYFWEMLPFMGENFSRAVYVWVKPWSEQGPHVFDKELVEREKPQVVVEEIAERFLVPIPRGAGAAEGKE